MAAPRAAGMPVRWPRRPCAVSAAVAAGAGPDFSCAGELEQPLKALIGEVRSLSVVCVCVSGLLGKVCGRVVDIPPWSVSSRVICACWGSGLCYSPKEHFLCLGASSCLFVLQVPPPGLGMCPGLVPSGGSIPPPGFGFGCCCCSRATCNRSCLLCVRLWCYAPYRRRSSECAVFGVCGCGSF